MLDNFSGFQAGDTDLVRATLFNELGATYFDLPKRDRELSVSLHWHKLQDVTLVSSVCNSATDVKYAPATFVRQYFETSPAGHFRFSSAGRSTELCRTAPAVIIPSDTPFRVESFAGHDLLVLRIDQKTLNCKMQSLLGAHAAHDVRFDENADHDTPRQHAMRQAVIQFASDLNMWGPDMPSLARADLQQALITKFLFCNDHNFSNKLAERCSSPSLLQLRLVEEYIEANWESPLDLESLATISNISARSIFRYFRGIRGTSPGDFIKAVRLRHARRLIQEALPNASVMAIAMRCGFRSLGHFSSSYRKAFGELPSETLRRARSSSRS